MLFLMSLLLIPTITPMLAHPLWYCANDKGKSNACIYKYYNDGTEIEMQKCYDDNLRTTYWMKKCYSERDECIRDCSPTACSGVDAICKGDTAKNFWDGVHKVWCFGTKDCTVCTKSKKNGDYNGDGTVNGLDYSWWKQEFVDKIQHEGKWEASPDCSEEITNEGYSVWRYNYYNDEKK